MQILANIISPELDALIAALPKAELHVHLEGSISPSTLLMLAKRNGIDLGCTDIDGLRDLYRFRDFPHFMKLYGEMTFALRNPEDFALVTEELGQEAARQNILYLEVTFSAGTHYRFKGIPFDEMMDAIAEGATAARREVGVEMRFIIDHVRGFSLADCQQTAEWCVHGRNRGVVALGLGGHELKYPAASVYAEAIRWAQAHSVPFVPHSGEVAGSEWMWDAIQFDPPRIGHGIRAVDDLTLVDYLREHGTVLEVCPTSNVCLGSVPSIEAHPLRRLWDAGVPITLNTDDPPMFNTTLQNEYRLAAGHFGFTPSELAKLSLTAVRASLLAPEDRTRLEATFQTKLHSLGL